MYIHTFPLRLTETMTSQNIDFSSWDILSASVGQFLDLLSDFVYSVELRWDVSA
jgi:hypothetical protein